MTILPFTTPVIPYSIVVTLFWGLEVLDLYASVVIKGPLVGHRLLSSPGHGKGPHVGDFDKTLTVIPEGPTLCPKVPPSS